MSGSPAALSDSCQTGWVTGEAVKERERTLLRPRRATPLIAPGLRPTVYVTIAIALIVFTALGVGLAGRTHLTTFDLRWDARVERLFGGHERLAVHLANLGGPLAAGLASIAIAVIALVLRRPRAVVLAALAAPVAAGLTDWVLKPLVDRAPFGTYTYPSGHSATAFALATVVVLLVLDDTNGRLARPMRVTVALAVLAVTCVVPLGLVAAGYHFVTDTFGGISVGIAVGLLLALAIDAIADRRSTSRRR
jgi:membrane-associated phospholipid phosphatase